MNTTAHMFYNQSQERITALNQGIDILVAERMVHERILDALYPLIQPDEEPSR